MDVLMQDSVREPQAVSQVAHVDQTPSEWLKSERAHYGCVVSQASALITGLPVTAS